jgi:hypothetical protein
MLALIYHIGIWSGFFVAGFIVGFTIVFILTKAGKAKVQ